MSSTWSIRSVYFRRCFFFQAEDGIRDDLVTGVQTCALPIYSSDHLGCLCAGVFWSCAADVHAGQDDLAESPFRISIGQEWCQIFLGKREVFFVRDRKSVV